MKKEIITTTVAAAFITTLVFAGSGFAKDDDESKITGGSIKLDKQMEAQFPSLAQITLDQAMQSAIGAVNGKVLKAGLENEDGFLVYEVEIAAQDNTITEVMVDAGNGKVLASKMDKKDGEDEGDEEHDERD